MGASADHDRSPDRAIQGVSVVIPAYNESRGLAPVLTELLTELDQLDSAIEVEVIVVDDGSTDDTAAGMSGIADDRVRLIRHPENRGYGAAIKTGVAASSQPWILITDADGTYPAAFIRTLLAERNSYDMVVGARTGASVNVPLIRRPPKWALRKLASYLSERHIPDLNSGLRVMRRDLVEQFENILPNRFSFTTTITLAMLSAGYHVKYVPIDYHKRTGKSKMKPISDTLNFVQLIVRTIMYFNPLKVFLPLSLLFIVASFVVGIGSYTITGQMMDVTTVVLFVTGIQVLALGMLADVLNRRLP